MKTKELQTSEKRYRRLFESAKDGILILNAEDGKIVDVNPFLIDMLGYSKEQFLTKNIWDISAFKNINYSKKLYRELQDNEYVRYKDIPLETSGGNKIHVEFVSNVYLVDKQKVIQCNIRDTTEWVNYEKKLLDDISEKEWLIDEIQHRAKNSFNLITSLIHLRSEKINSVKTRKEFQELTLRVSSIADLYSLLQETGSYDKIRLDIYCNKIVESMLRLSNNCTINKHLKKITIPVKNATTVGMILLELLSNAIKYAFPNSQHGLINIELKNLDNKIVLMVKDNGIGLKSDFDINKSESLGLHLVNLMVDQLNGKINFMSEKGTKVTIEFPL